MRHEHCTFSGFWIVLFFALKFDTALVGWSWWWVLMPIVPDLAWILRRFQLL